MSPIVKGDRRAEGFFQFEIIVNVLASSFRFVCVRPLDIF